MTTARSATDRDIRVLKEAILHRPSPPGMKWKNEYTSPPCGWPLDRNQVFVDKYSVDAYNRRWAPEPVKPNRAQRRHPTPTT